MKLFCLHANSTHKIQPVLNGVYNERKQNFTSKHKERSDVLIFIFPIQVFLFCKMINWNKWKEDWSGGRISYILFVI